MVVRSNPAGTWVLALGMVWATACTPESSTPTITVVTPLGEVTASLPPSHDDVAAIGELVADAGGALRLPAPLELPGGIDAEVVVVRVDVTAPIRTARASITAYDGPDVVVSVQTAGTDSDLPCRDEGTDDSDPAGWAPLDFRGAGGCVLEDDVLTSIRWFEAGNTFHAEFHTVDRDAVMTWLTDWVLLP